MRLPLAIAAVVLALLAAAPAGHAAVVTSLSAGRLEVRMTAGGDAATVARSGASLVVLANGVAAHSAPIDGVTAIAILDVSGGGTQAAIDLGGGRFLGPGRTATVDLGAGPATDVMWVLGEGGGDKIVLGTGGLNVTADEDAAVDVANPQGVDRWVLEGRGGHDLLTAGGGYGAGAAATVPVEVVAGAGGGVFSGGAADDVVRGAAGNDQLYGGAGADLLDGGGGSDQVAGGVGDDVIENGAGPDDLQGDAGRDALRHSAIGAGVDIDLGRDMEGAGAAGDDRIDGIEVVVGTPFADRLGGNEGSNELVGQGGDDVVRGRGGHDALDGGEGDDELEGDAGQDAVSGGPGRDTAGYASSPGGISVVLTAGGQGRSGAAAGVDALTGIEDVDGSPHNDELVGNAGPNRLRGGAGRDGVVGGAGADVLDGGADDDAIESADETEDAVDCGAGEDIVDADGKDAIKGCEARGKRKTSKKPKRGGGSPAGDETRPIGVTRLQYRGRSARLRVAVRLSCPKTARFACRGTIRLKTQQRKRGGRVQRRLAARLTQFKTILSGKSRRVELRLWPTARRVVDASRRRAKLVVLVTARDGRRTNISTRVVRRPSCAPSQRARRCVSGR